ncbi:MAG: glutamine--fructose-6-phosphate transaminase (isomerizing) [Clostridia bacterium]|nr:glutamine--fructose-6-phosphate transaminase (isomerizing) [Clostridia bacterium]
MCGIVGYTGENQAAPILLDGLKRLEYRGYDSAGLAVRDGDALAEVVKATGKLYHLADKTDQGRSLPGNCGIGHTRWATHGDPSLINAHPHVSGNCSGSGSGKVESDVVGVHNGIIENYGELKEKLLRHGYRFYSDTDTEVVVKLVDYYYKKYKIGPVDAITRTMVRVRGSYALALMFKDYPGEIFAARKDSPLIIGTAENAAFLASDVPAILKYTRSVYYIGNLQVARLSPGSVKFYDLNGDEIALPLTEITWDAEAAEKGGYEHFMLKEIHEQPAAVRDTLGSLVKNGKIDLTAAGITDDMISSLSQIIITACGSAWHVGMAAQYVIEDMAKVPVRVELASEFRYRSLPMSKNTLVIVISQSGETADSLAALRLAKEKGAETLAVVNVVGSTIAREADHVLYTLAGPEIAVATTKAYSAQLIALDALAVQMALVKGNVSAEQYGHLIEELIGIPDKIIRVLEDKERLQWFSSKIANAHDIFFIGRGLDYAISLEGSLKMKEISYIHSEAYAAGELKHGTISLIEKNTLVIGVLTQSQMIEKTISNMAECKSRGAYLMGVTTNGNFSVEDSVNFTVYIPRTDEHFVSSLAVVPLQLLGYYTSVNRGLDVDKPRNLAKSVTVE